MSTSDAVTEAFLEMYFARALADMFASVYGARFLRLWKPSPNGETFVGFDQGWVRHAGPARDFETALRRAIRTKQTAVPNFFVGYFMQFKRVQHMLRPSKFTAPSILGEHFRVEVDLAPSPTTGISQHETLTRLARIRGGDVSYACGMVFDAHAIYDTADLDLLRIVPVDETVVQASSQWQADERHFIQFQDVTKAPVWCSEPFQGRAFAPDTWAREQRPQSAEEVLNLLREARGILQLDQGHMVPFFTLLEFEGAQHIRG